MPLRVLQTEYALVAGPIVAFVDRLRQQRDERIFVLIPVVLPGQLRYRFLHNHLDLSSPGRCGTVRTSSSPASRCECASETAPHRCGLRARASGTGEDRLPNQPT